MKKIFIALVMTVAQLYGLSFAKERLPELKKGMSQSEVLTKAGAPLSKTVKEVKREEVWYYNGYAVSFKEGCVNHVEGLLAPHPTFSSEEMKAAEGKSKRRETPPDLLRSILKELPASAGTVEPGAAKLGSLLPGSAVEQSAVGPLGNPGRDV